MRAARFRIAWILAGLGVISSLPESGAQEPPPGEVVSEDLIAEPSPLEGAEADAARAYAEGDLPKAISIYRELGSNHPDLAQRTRLKVTAAWLLFETGDRAAAGQELEAALFAQPAYELRADLYSADFLALFQDAQVRAATERQRVAIAKLKDGLAAAKQGDRKTARTLLGESLELTPMQPAAIHAVAALDLAEGNTDAALAGFEKVLAFERSSPELVPRDLKAQALNNVGVIHIGREEYEDAAAALERAASLAPADARIWLNLGLARLALGKRIDGSQALERAHELDPRDAEVALELARTYEAAGSWIEAVALLLEATKLAPEDARLRLELGRAQVGIGNRQGARESFRRVIELDPENRGGNGKAAAIALAEIELDESAFAPAAEAARRATALAPEEANAWVLLGLAQRGLGQLPDAVASLEKAAALAPARADIAHNLGTAYLAQRRLPEAEAAFRRALELDPTFSESGAALARVQSARTEPATANRSRRDPPRRDLGATIAPVDYQPLGIRGLIVQQVAPGGLAAKAGLKVDDLILRADGSPLTSVATLLALIKNSNATALRLSVLRAGKPLDLQLPLS